MKTLFKTVLREIRHSFGRFAALFLITALGVGFLAGLLSTAPDFYSTIDSYYNKYSFMDFNIKSTGGLTNEDVSCLKNESYVEKVTPMKSTDVTINDGENNDTVARISGTNIEDIKNKKTVNQLKLISGKYPENSNECLASSASPMMENPKVGTTLKVLSKDSNLVSNEFTVVGIVESPVYMSVEKESSSVGNGRVKIILYSYESAFNTDYYTDIFLTVKNTQDKNTFYDDYKTLRNECKIKIEKLAKVRESKRFEEMKKTAVEKALNTNEGKAAAAMGLSDKIIEEAEKKISTPKWYILDRDTNPSFVSLTANAEKVNAIAKVFPLFFFLVAALVGLTTMTRMVDEQRTEIGTLKALGYSGSAIAAKYLLYSGIAAVTGGIVGLAVGLYVLPMVIINVYRIMYRVPDIIINFNAPISVTAFAAAVICIIIATFSAVISNLRDVPASLMLPKAPKSGKRILLENIPFIWNRMKFTHKVTARNLFRYKKRFFMTIIGVSGCTALLLTGFGLKDAIGNIVSKQYEHIQKYDLTVKLSDNNTDNAIKFIDDNFKSNFAVHAENGRITTDNQDYDINIYVPSDSSNFKKYINLKERKTGKAITFNSNSVIITEKFATTHNIKVGDFVIVENNNENTAKFKVTGICENYIYSYIYISPEKYTKAFNSKCDYSTILVKSGISDVDEDIYTTKLLNLSGVTSASFSTSIIESFGNMIDRINYIVLVLIIAAGMLAFVVLYNLTNINISERQKEIATIKVLGFFDGEVKSYICRETYALSFLGTILGLILGIFLCHFVVITAEVDMVMFERTIFAHSYIYSAVITIIFTVIVNLFMSKKLKRIDMVESMKSVD